MGVARVVYANGNGATGRARDMIEATLHCRAADGPWMAQQCRPAALLGDRQGGRIADGRAASQQRGGECPDISVKHDPTRAWGHRRTVLSMYLFE